MPFNYLQHNFIPIEMHLFPIGTICNKHVLYCCICHIVSLRLRHFPVLVQKYMTWFRFWKYWRICLTLDKDYLLPDRLPKPHPVTLPPSPSPLQGFPHLECLCQLSQWRNPFCQIKSYSSNSNLLLYLALVSSLSRLYNVPQKVSVVSEEVSHWLPMKCYLLRMFSTKDRAGAEMFPVKLLGQLRLRLFQLWQRNSGIGRQSGNTNTVDSRKHQPLKLTRTLQGGRSRGLCGTRWAHWGWWCAKACPALWEPGPSKPRQFVWG